MAERTGAEQVYVVSDGSEPGETPEVMGFKAYNLLRMARIGLPVPAAFAARSPWLNWASLTALAALLYYLLLSPRLALGIALAFAALLALTHALAQAPWPLWASSLTIFVIAWIGQFIGHAIEGARPSFFKDLQFLLIGPLWLLAATYRRARLAY